MWKQIIKGWSKLLAKQFGFISDELLEVYEMKSKLCTYDCPLKTKKIGFMGFCDEEKSLIDLEGNRIQGCGCYDKAKFLTDSRCPLGRF